MWKEMQLSGQNLQDVEARLCIGLSAVPYSRAEEGSTAPYKVLPITVYTVIFTIYILL
jgi:hypothetical protein